MTIALAIPPLTVKNKGDIHIYVCVCVRARVYRVN